MHGSELLPTAVDWMAPSDLVFAPEQDLFAAMEQLIHHRLPAAPVVDRNEQLLGMLTEKDCLRVLSNLTYDGSLEGGTVADYQSAIRLKVRPEMDLFQVAEMFLATNFPVLPVVDADERLLGLISRLDMLRGIEAFRRRLLAKQKEWEEGAGHQADRPRTIESMQRTAANRTREQLVRLFHRPR